MYVCGVTIYDHCHLGHAKSAINFDIIRRYLTYRGYFVNYIVNITDVGHLMGDADEGEDKIAKRAKEKKVEPMELVDIFIKSMWDDFDKLKILRPNISPRATGHLLEMIDVVKKLIEYRYAYEVNGTVYFDLKEFLNKYPDTDYGKLSGRKIEKEKSGIRVEIDPNKKNPFDFVLWKNAEPEHIMRWTSPWGKGYPGWHLECSTMGTKYLGQPFDIHGGGIEHTNLHHECEIVQAEGVEGKKFVNYWLHNGMLNVDGQKMSKSLGNFVTLKELLDMYSARALRLLIIQSHYRSQLNYTQKSIEDAQKTIERLDNFVIIIKNFVEYPSDKNYNQTVQDLIKKSKNEFEKAMDNDFDSPTSMALIFKFITDIYNKRDKRNKKNAEEILEFLKNVNSVFDILVFEGKKSESTEINKEFIEMIIEIREDARKNKNWELADKLRDGLKSAGIKLEDSIDGVIWKMKN